MGYSIQNSETGELDYIHCDVSDIKHQEFDEETGEPIIGQFKVRYVKHKRFQIPKKYLRATPCEEFDLKITGAYQENFQASGIQYMEPKVKKEEQKTRERKKQYDDYINMDCVKNEIVLGYNKDNFRIFLIPTLFCFNMYFAFFMGLLESFLHFWAHKKNGLNMNKEVYYRSPLHILTSQFCAICRSESEMDIHLFDMLNKQMRRARKSKTLKEVTKALS